MEKEKKRFSIPPSKLQFSFLDKYNKIWLIDKKIGAGSFGVVYSGFSNLYEDVAIKIIDKSSSYFEKYVYEVYKEESDEFIKKTKINYLPIVDIKSISDQNEYTYIVMELGTCIYYINYNLIECIKQMTYAIDFIKPYFGHCDIKESNILLVKDKFKLTDFSIISIDGTNPYNEKSYYYSGIYKDFRSKDDIWSLAFIVLDYYGISKK